jgi:2-methylisocitrate lyase-like PEP mutase family enzyme
MIDPFRDMHGAGMLLVLPNAWDAASARIAEDAGAEAIATSSAAVAWACGYPDGGFLPVRELLGAVERIHRVLSVPLSVDVEDGYSDDPAAVAELVAEVRQRGAVGINLEDGSKPPEFLEAKIAAIKARLRAAGDDIFVNARCDVYLRDLTAPQDMIRESIARAERYAAAGADGFFLPFVEPDDIASVTAAVTLPLNVLATPDLPGLDVLRARGVRRLSAGGAIAKGLYSEFAIAARDFLRDGTWQRSATKPTDLNALLQRG